MELVLNSKLKFNGVETRTSQKTNKPYSLVILRDMDKFEEFQFFKTDDLIINGLKENDDVYCEFEISKRGYDVQVNLTAIRKLGQ